MKARALILAEVRQLNVEIARLHAQLAQLDKARGILARRLSRLTK